MDISMGISLSQTKEEERPEEEHEAPPKSKGDPIWARFKATMEEHGGAQQYLLQKYPRHGVSETFRRSLAGRIPAARGSGLIPLQVLPAA